ncbi:MAG: hypothetical protein ACYTHM_18435 [Planctomycetota bacterium]|jgi:hypothetical protein
MKVCESCQKKTYGGKHREVVLQGKRVVLCGECGRIAYTTLDGEKREGQLQSINMPLRKGQRGRRITFLADQVLQKGERIQEASFQNLPIRTSELPVRYQILKARPLVVREVEPAGGEGEKGKRPRRRKRTVGYAIQACSA